MTDHTEGPRTAGYLSDPRFETETQAGTAEEAPLLLRGLFTMKLIRAAEYRIAAARRDGLIGGPVHLGIGQEAIASGVALHLSSNDRVFGAHRSHSHVLALGSDVRALFAEVLGRDSGLSRGMGGSMHLWDQARGFMGSTPIVAGTVPLAVGAGLACRLRNSDAVAVAFFGDGAVEEGIVHESLNLAVQLRSPTLFVVENNLFASHMHLSQRQPSEFMSRFARAHHMGSLEVDGNDLVSVMRAAGTLLDSIRATQRPALLEAFTFRWLGHVDWREDIDVGVQRSAEDVAAWRKRDPILRLSSGLLEKGICTQDDLEEMDRTIESQIERSWIDAMSDPFPHASSLLDRVYAGRENHDH